MFILHASDVKYCQIKSSQSGAIQIRPALRYRGHLFVKLTSLACDQLAGAIHLCRQYLERQVPVTSIIVKEPNCISLWLLKEKLSLVEKPDHEPTIQQPSVTLSHFPKNLTPVNLASQLNQPSCFSKTPIDTLVKHPPLPKANSPKNLINKDRQKEKYQSSGRRNKSIQSVPIVACVDDSKSVQFQVKKILETVGYRVLSIPEPTTALTALVRYQPILILMDINMPELNGFELCEMLQRSRKLKNIPVVMLTGKEGIMNQLRAKWLGVMHYLKKPFEPQQLIEVVNSVSSRTKVKLSVGSVGR